MKKKKEYISVIVLFICLSVIINYKFIFMDNVTAINGTDSSSQFTYFIQFVQKCIKNGDIFWSWSNGLGGDVFAEFSYYYTTNILFYIISIFKVLGMGIINIESALDFKLVLIVIKQVVSMFGMYVLLRYENRKSYSSLIGSIVYGISIWFIVTSYRFDYMVDVVMFIPITILGFRMWLKTKKNWLLILGITLTVINNFYFAYMALIFYGIYFLVFVNIEGITLKEKLLNWINEGIKFSLKVFLSIGIASFTFIPSVISLLSSDRVPVEQQFKLFFNKYFYMGFFDRLFLYEFTLGIPLLLLIIFAVNYFKCEKDTKRKIILLIIMIILYCLPITYSMFNGFSYPADRWLFLFIFTIAYVLPEVLDSVKFNFKKAIVFLGIIGILVILSIITRNKRGFAVITKRELFVLGIGLISIILFISRFFVKKRLVKNVLSYSVTFCVIITSVFNSFMNIKKVTYMKPAQLSQRGMQNSIEQDIFSKMIPSENEFYRTLYRVEGLENAPLSYGYYGASVYNSLLNATVHKWMKLEYNIRQRYVSTSRFQEFDDRLFLETFFGTRYKVEYENYNTPAGYSKVDQTGEYSIYKLDNEVGFDLWYDTYESVEEYNKWNYAQKDARILQTAVVEGNTNLKNNNDYDDVTKDFSLNLDNATLHNISYENDIIDIKEGVGEITIPIEHIDRDENGEFLFVLNIESDNIVNITVNDKKAVRQAPGYAWDYPIKDYTFKIESDAKSISIQLLPGKYQFKNMKLYYNSYSEYNKWVQERNKYNLQNLIVDGSKVSGNIKVDENGILAVSIPYNSKGWKCYVNGEEVELLKINGILTGIELQKGNYEIEMKYTTPGLKVGVIISIISVIIVCIMYYRKRKEKDGIKVG